MNILLPDSWLREYLKTKASAGEIKDCLSLSGPSFERVEKVGNDFIYHIEITSNRPDMASVLGIAAEAAAILPRFGIKAKLDISTIQSPARNSFAQAIAGGFGHLTIKLEKELPLEVKILDQSLCPRFTAIILDNITLRPSPQLAQDRLNKSGIRAINNVVDISNYLMCLFGQPVHTFDYDKIKNATMILRESKIGEEITTLDGKTFKLAGKDIVIEDGSGRLIDLCGIMGGENSAVGEQTKRVLLFVQTYDPYRIRKTSMYLGQRTPAVTFFEKNLDPENVMPTILYGIHLFKEYTGAKPAGKLIDIYPHPYKPKIINVTPDFINDRIGIKLSENEIINILKSLGFFVNSLQKENSVLKISVPSIRANDINIPEDIVEEVARLYGYHRLPAKLMAGQIPITDKPKNLPLELKVKTMLKYWGFTEVYNYSFVSKALIEKANLKTTAHLRVANPLTAETEYMRISLLPSLLENIRYNQHLKKDLALFELSKVYLPKPDDLPKEETNLVLAWQSDFFKLKGILASLLLELGIIDCRETNDVTWKFGHPKQSLLFRKNGETIARVASLHPEIANNFEIKGKFFIAEVDIDRIVSYFRPVKKYHPIPSFPPAIEDLTLSVATDTRIGPIIEEIEKLDPLVANVWILDRYKNAITLRITYQNLWKNLTGEDVKQIRAKIISHLETKFNITLKK